MTPLPENPDSLTSVPFDLPRLSEDSAASCPVSIGNILDHLRREAASDGVTAADLGFLRTARVDDSDYWIWRFTDPSGAECFVTASINGTRSEIGFDENYDDLTPEQFILATERRWI